MEYLKNSVFEAIILQYRKTYKTKKRKPKEFEEAKAKLAEAFFLLSERIFKGYKFQLIDLDDALQEGVIIGFEKLDHFDSNRGKAFSFFTQIISNHFKQMYRHAKGFNELRIKYTEYVISEDGNLDNGKSRKKQKYVFKNGNDYLRNYDEEY